MQAIKTKWISATINHGTRVKAICQAGSVTLPMDFALTGEQNEQKAVQALLNKLGWDYDFVSGVFNQDETFHVLIDNNK